MTGLVTLPETKRLLRIASDDDNAMLEMLIEAASSSVINYLKDEAANLLDLDTSGEFVGLDLDTSGELIGESPVPGPIRVATIMLVGYLYENPDSDPDSAFEMGYLPKPVMALLYPLRDPALA